MGSEVSVLDYLALLTRDYTKAGRRWSSYLAGPKGKARKGKSPTSASSTSY